MSFEKYPPRFSSMTLTTSSKAEVVAVPVAEPEKVQEVLLLWPDSEPVPVSLQTDEATFINDAINDPGDRVIAE